MTSSKEIMNYLRENIDKKNIVSMFVAGSMPIELIPQSDLDIFIVIKNNYRNTFFNNLESIMDKFIN